LKKLQRYDPAIRKVERAWPAALALLLPLAGCGGGDPGVPVACSGGPGTVRTALASAPRPVRLDGTRLSKCLARGSTSADVQEIGGMFLTVTQQLAPQARAAPGSRAAVELGYLVGALRRGAGQGFGVYYESERRVESELRGVDQSSPAFRQAEQAGERSG
jgi:hypothetical protein